MSSYQILARVLGNLSLVLSTALIRPLIFDQRRPGRTTQVGRDLALSPSLAYPSSLAIHSPAPGPIHRHGDNHAGPLRPPNGSRLLPWRDAGRGGPLAVWRPCRAGWQPGPAEEYRRDGRGARPGRGRRGRTGRPLPLPGRPAVRAGARGAG